MPWFAGFLRQVKRRPGGGGPPDWGIEEGERPEVEPPDPDGGDGDRPPFEKPLPTPPPGIWPGATIDHPFEPVPEPPDGPDVPPGTIWPSPGTPEHPIKPGNKLWILVVFDGKWYYVCVDPGLLVPPVDTWLPEGTPPREPKK